MGRPRSNGQATKPETVEAKEKAAQALELRKEGYGFQEIADKLGYNSVQAAHAAVKRSIMAIIREPAEELIKVELERIDKMWRIHYVNAYNGDPDALKSCLKLMERRAKLLGLDAAQKIEDVTGLTRTKPIEECSTEEAQRAYSELRGQPI